MSAPPWNLPHSVIECYSGIAGQIDPCCEIWYFAPGVIVEWGVYLTPCIDPITEYYVTLGACRAALDEKYPPPPPPYGTVTVNLQPELDGALLELVYNHYYNGYVEEIVLASTYTQNGRGFFSGENYETWWTFHVRFPTQTIGGITYLEAETSKFAFGTKQYEFDLPLEEALPSSATVTVGGKCTGGDPSPSMVLEIYDMDVLIESRSVGVISIGSVYETSVVVTGAGTHQVHGRMVLTNPLGSLEYTTAVEQFELSETG